MRKIAVVLALVLLAAVPTPKPAEANLLWLLIPLFENALNRKATEPMDRSTSECRVTANASWQGKTYGTQFDLTKWVIGVRCGAVVNLDAVLVAKPGLTKMVAAEVHCNDPEFRPLKAIAMPQPDRRGVRRLNPDGLYVTESGCIFPVDTAGMEFKGYTLQVDLYFNNGKKQAGLFGTERVPYSDSTRTLVQLVVMDDQQISASISDPGVQKALQWSFGLQPTVPQIAPLSIPLSDEATDRILNIPPPQAPAPQPQQPQYQAPAPQQQAPQYQPPAQQSQPSIATPPTIDKAAQFILRPGDQAWWKPCSWERPSNWTPGDHCSVVLFFLDRRYNLLHSGNLDERDVEWWINGDRQDMNLPSHNSITFPDHTPSCGVIYQRMPSDANVEVSFRGKRYSFSTTHQNILWRPIMVAE